MLAANVVINEINYDPLIVTELVEFVELYNAGDEEADLTQWAFTDGIEFTFPAGTTLPPDGYLVVSQDPAAVQQKYNVSSLGPFIGRLTNEGEDLVLRDALGDVQDQVDYQLGFPWPTVGDDPGSSIELINPALENDIGGNWRSSLQPRRGIISPTAGKLNSTFSENAAPAARQVDHTPNQPTSADDVTITVKVTDPDAVASVSLEYQLVDPGSYINIDDPEYQTNWTSIAMLDDGNSGDEVAGDNIYTVVLSADLQEHRRLVRYRIVTEDGLGEQITVPYEDDPQPNFAYYVYDAVPDWTFEEGFRGSGEITYEAELLETLPIYQLITSRESHEDALFIPDSTRGSGYTSSDYLWNGTLVYDGEVYDHIRYRARGGVWRYAMGKNMWKFDFNRGHYFQGRDDYGNKYDTKWDKLNFSALIQQGDYLHRGEQGLFESVGFRLFNLAGVEGPNTSYAHFRVVENADENGPDKFNTDFQGLYLTIEQPDGRLLEEHGLPDGNFYKMESGTGTLNNQGPTQPSDRSDLNAFISTGNSNPGEDWWRENLDLERYYSYRSIVEGIHHYDIAGGKNYFYFNNPETGKWQVHPWDLDLTWANNMFGSGNEPFKSRVLSINSFAQEYRNRQRELRDLLYNGEQTGMLIDEYAALVYTPGEPSFVDADRDLWDTNPILTSSYVNSNKAGHGRFYQSATTRDFPGMIQLMKDYVDSRSAWIDSTILTDEAGLPVTSTVTYTGEEGFAANQLSFRTTEFTSRNRDKFAAMEWRLAEITDPDDPNFDPTKPRKYEIDSKWESGEITEFSDSITIPGNIVKEGRTYRVRVRMKDTRGARWGHWSDPVQFIAGPPTGELVDGLRVTEIMYNPDDPDPENSQYNNDDFEFVELQNIGNTTFDLNGVKFTNGIDFDFTDGNVTSLAPGEFVVVVSHAEAFAARYGDGIDVAGSYDGRLNNGGDRLRLEDPLGGVIQNFRYNDGETWPASADGEGYSLEIIDTASDYDEGASWRASSELRGSPGSEGTEPNPGATIAEVKISGSEWSTDFTDHLSALGAGDGGYELALENLQTEVLPWVNIDTVKLTFSEDVTIGQDNLAVHGVAVSDYLIDGFEYDPASLTATWKLAQPFGGDKLLLSLSDWNPQGDVFTFRFNILPGDTTQNGEVNNRDLQDLRIAMLSVTAEPNYSPLSDFDANATIDVRDLQPLRDHLLATLPTEEPTQIGQVLSIETLAQEVPILKAPETFKLKLQENNDLSSTATKALVEESGEVESEFMQAALYSIALRSITSESSFDLDAENIDEVLLEELATDLLAQD